MPVPLLPVLPLPGAPVRSAAGGCWVAGGAAAALITTKRSSTALTFPAKSVAVAEKMYVPGSRSV